MSQPRIAPVGPDLDEPLKSAMAKVFPLPLPAPVLYRTVARNESLFVDLVERRVIGRTGPLDRKTFPPALRELLILRTCVAARNEYELNLHEKTISETMGLTRAQITEGSHRRRPSRVHSCPRLPRRVRQRDGRRSCSLA